jgi:hypothetical protein
LRTRVRFASNEWKWSELRRSVDTPQGRGRLSHCLSQPCLLLATKTGGDKLQHCKTLPSLQGGYH